MSEVWKWLQLTLSMLKLAPTAQSATPVALLAFDLEGGREEEALPAGCTHLAH
jgi:hypothetical protein